MCVCVGAGAVGELSGHICMLTAGCVHAVGHVCEGPTASGFPMKDPQQIGVSSLCKRGILGSLQFHTCLLRLRKTRKEGSVKWISGHFQGLLSAQMGVDVFITQIPLEH